MELTEKNGHQSMEEILASIRRIIAEEPGGMSPLIDLNAPRPLVGDGLLDDPSDFDLPSMFRSATPSTGRPAPLFGRLSEAIRAASSTAQSHEGLSSLKLQRSDFAAPADDAALGADMMAASGGQASAFLLAAFHETTNSRNEESARMTGSDPIPSAVAPEAVADPEPMSLAPQVPRQMAAFKDTRFCGMGTPPAPIEPSAFGPTSFDTATAVAFEPVPVLSFAALPQSPEPVAEAPVPAAFEPAYPMTLGDAKPAADLGVPTPPPLTQVAEPAPAEIIPGAPIEDATADLLRPMLRQWLADNMPRMVEKALHIEVAETVRSTRKPNGQG